jgi:hypothetical protein
MSTAYTAYTACSARSNTNATATNATTWKGNQSSQRKCGKSEEIECLKFRSGITFAKEPRSKGSSTRLPPSHSVCLFSLGICSCLPTTTLPCSCARMRIRPPQIADRQATQRPKLTVYSTCWHLIYLRSLYHKYNHQIVSSKEYDIIQSHGLSPGYFAK